jgi:hypothetical protein
MYAEVFLEKKKDTKFHLIFIQSNSHVKNDMDQM